MYVKCKGNFMEVKCFCHLYWFTASCMPLKVNFSYFEIQIFMLSNWNPNPESESGESAMQKVCNRIRNPKIFWPDCHPWLFQQLYLHKEICKLIKASTSKKKLKLLKSSQWISNIVYMYSLLKTRAYLIYNIYWHNCTYFLIIVQTLAARWKWVVNKGLVILAAKFHNILPLAVAFLLFFDTNTRKWRKKLIKKSIIRFWVRVLMCF